MKNRWIVLAAAVITQTILGGIYAWSTFTPHLIRDYGLSKGQSGFIFGVAIAIFTLTMTFAGRIIHRVGTRVPAVIGALLFMTGYLLASWSNGSYLQLLTGIGIISGVGIGFIYSSPLIVCMKWFPDKKGVVTGLAVAGFGGGAIILSSIAGKALLSINVLEFFQWFGVISGGILLMSTFFLTEPETVKKKADKKCGIKAAFSKPFILLTAGIFSGTFAGLLVIGNLCQIVPSLGLNSEQAIFAISVFAFGNVSGRIFWGYVFDRINYSAIPIFQSIFVVILLLFQVPQPAWSIIFCIGAIGFCFGANFVVYAGAISRYFGMDSFASLYPLCFLGYGVAGLVGPSTGGWIADYFGSYEISIYLSAAVVFFTVLVFIVSIKLLQSHNDKSSEGDTNSDCLQGIDSIEEAV